MSYQSSSCNKPQLHQLNSRFNVASFFYGTISFLIFQAIANAY